MGVSAKGGAKVAYKVTKKSPRLEFSKGKVTVKAGTKKGAYSMKVKATAAATANYKAATKTFKVSVSVK